MFARKKKHLTFKLIFTILILGTFAIIFVPFTVPLLLAAVVAFAVDPTLEKFNRPNMPCRKNFVVIGILVAALVTFVPIGIAGYKLYSKAVQISQGGLQNSEIFHSLMAYKNRIFEYGNSLLSRVGLSSTVQLNDMANELLGNTGKFALGATTYAIALMPEFLLSLFIFFMALYMFLTQSKAIKLQFLKMDLLQLSETDAFIRVIQKTSYVTMTSSLLIGAIQASTVAIGGWIFGRFDVLVVFVLTFFFSFIPVIGAAPVAVILALVNFAMGNNGSAIAMLVVAGVAGSIDNILRPYMVADEELHPVMSLISILGAIIVFGISGLFLGPVLGTLSIKVIPIFFKKRGFFQELDKLHPVVTLPVAPVANAPGTPIEPDRSVVPK